MQKLIRISAALLIVILSVVATRMSIAMAQNESEGPFADPTQLEGLEEAVRRTYTLNYSSLMSEASPNASGNFEYQAGIQALFTAVYKFDSEDHAKESLDKAKAQIEEEGIAGVEFEEVEMDDLNDDTLGLTATADQEGAGTTVSTVVLTQEDDYLYLVFGIAIGTDTDVNGIVGDLVKYLIDEDAGDGDPTFNDDGTSEGGIWDKFPDADHDLVKGLDPTDEQVFPVPAE